MRPSSTAKFLVQGMQFCIHGQVSLLCIQETKLDVIAPAVLLEMLDTGATFRGGILVAWRTDIWSLTDHTISLRVCRWSGGLPLFMNRMRIIANRRSMKSTRESGNPGRALGCYAAISAT